jgi:predicted small secreted protein
LKKFVLLFVALSTLSALTAGCNTMRGLGQDIEKGGEAIQRGATK